MKRFSLVVALVLFLGLAQIACADTAPDSPWDDPVLRTRIEPALLKQLIASKPSEQVPAIVVMREQAAPRLDRAALVPNLQTTASRSQSAVRTFLSDEERSGRAKEIRSFWIFNGLALKAVPETVRTLALRDDVSLVRLDHYERRVSRAPNDSLGEQAHLSTTAAQGSGPAWGIKQIRADQVWSAFNITGAGVVVANMDTGVDFLHPALNANYRGNGAKGLYQHTGNWFDATSDATSYPYDGYGHGTHTMGTLAGQDGIGVAPGTRWIAARVLDSNGYGYDSWIHAGFEWILAPAGDPKLAPQVLSNSWGSSNGGSTEFQADLSRLRQAGIFVVFSAGNDGPDPGTVGSPAALPNAFAVGATDGDDEIAPFSSRGPSPWNQAKPQVAAPGVNVSSAIPGGGFANYSGTSMAAPHVAGIAALMIAVSPGLTVTSTEYALTSTAVSRASMRPDNNTGWGRVDAYAAVQAVAGAGILAGQVVDAGSYLPLPGAQIAMLRYGSDTNFSTQADGAGKYRTALAAGTYQVTGSLFGYQPRTVSPVTVVTGTTRTLDLPLDRLPTGVVRGALYDAAAQRPVTATVSAHVTPAAQTATGEYHLDLPAGTYTLEARGMGYRVITATVTVSAGQVTQQDFAFVQAPRVLLVNSGAWYYEEYPAYFRQALDGLGYVYDEVRIKHPPADTPGAKDLQKYDLVVWSSPKDSPGLISAGEAITRYLKSGGRMILTGQDVAFWDDGGSGVLYAPYYRQYLKTGFAADDSGSRTVTGQPDTRMAGLTVPIEGGDGAGNQLQPDEITVADTDHASSLLRYAGAGLAGNQVGLCLPYRAVVLGFGFEAIRSATERREVMQRAIEYLMGPAQAEGFSLTRVTPQIGVGSPGSVVTFTLRARNTGETGTALSYGTDLRSAGWTASITPPQFTLEPCASSLVTVTVRVPNNAAVDAGNPLTLTVTPLAKPTLAQALTLTAKAPAPILLVDHHRWYDGQSDYVKVLQQAKLPFDVWTPPSDGQPGNLNGPAASRLGWYPVVLWFTGYDWYRPMTTDDEKQLGAYLDGGGRLMLSSAFYLADHLGSAFARDRLGVLDYTTGMTATQSFGSPGHALGTGLARISLIDPFPRAGFFTLDPVVVPSAAAATAWRGDHQRGQAIARSEAGNRVAFWTIPIEALPAHDQANVIRRTVGWLSSLGRSSIEVTPPVVAAGQPVTVTMVMRNDWRPTQASMMISLPAGLQPDPAFLPSGLTYDPVSNTLHYSGAISTSQPQSFVFRLKTEGAGAGRSVGSVIFRDEQLGLEYDQPLQVAIAAPDLKSSQLEVSAAHAGIPATVSMKVRNSGPGDAQTAVANGVLPVGAEVITGTLTVEGPGEAQLSPSGVTWQGPLTSGQTATITCQIRPASSTQTASLPVEMLAWDGLGGGWEWRTWFSVRPYMGYMPIIRK